MCRIVRDAQALRLSGQDALAVRASKKLRSDELLLFNRWPRAELNHRHKDFQSSALPTELLGQAAHFTRSISGDLSLRRYWLPRKASISFNVASGASSARKCPHGSMRP